MMLRPRMWQSVAGWMMAAVLVLLVPDIRVPQNGAYAFTLYFGKLEWAIGFRVFCLAGGLLWAMAADHRQRCVPRRHERTVGVYRTMAAIAV